LDKRARELWETQGNKQKVNTNRRQACTLWKKAAENGDLAAQYTIATFQLNGNAIEYGILKDVKSALKTLHSLAEKHQHALANVRHLHLLTRTQSSLSFFCYLSFIFSVLVLMLCLVFVGYGICFWSVRCTT
jgi:TPR repeat protein